MKRTTVDNDMNRFPDLQTAFYWIAGVRGLSGDKPGDMRSLRGRLIDNGMAILLHFDTRFGGVSCIAEFPSAKTEADIINGDWFDEPEQDWSQFWNMPIAGNDG